MVRKAFPLLWVAALLLLGATASLAQPAQEPTDAERMKGTFDNIATSADIKGKQPPIDQLTLPEVEEQTCMDCCAPISTPPLGNATANSTTNSTTVVETASTTNSTDGSAARRLLSMAAYAPYIPSSIKRMLLLTENDAQAWRDNMTRNGNYSNWGESTVSADPDFSAGLSASLTSNEITAYSDATVDQDFMTQFKAARDGPVDGLRRRNLLAMTGELSVEPYEHEHYSGFRRGLLQSSTVQCVKGTNNSLCPDRVNLADCSNESDKPICVNIACDGAKGMCRAGLPGVGRTDRKSWEEIAGIEIGRIVATAVDQLADSACGIAELVTVGTSTGGGFFGVAGVEVELNVPAMVCHPLVAITKGVKLLGFDNPFKRALETNAGITTRQVAAAYENTRILPANQKKLTERVVTLKTTVNTKTSNVSTAVGAKVDAIIDTQEQEELLESTSGAAAEQVSNASAGTKETVENAEASLLNGIAALRTRIRTKGCTLRSALRKLRNEADLHRTMMMYARVDSPNAKPFDNVPSNQAVVNCPLVSDATKTFDGAASAACTA